MDLIIGRFLTPLNYSRTMGSVRRRDDNSRRKVQNVRGDSSERLQGKVVGSKDAINRAHEVERRSDSRLIA
jgi:hypothetical protein